MSVLTPEKLQQVASSDRELAYKLRGFSGRVRVDVGDAAIDVVVTDGTVSDVTAAGEEAATVTLRGPQEAWAEVFKPGIPTPGYESLTAAFTSWLTVEGDYLGAIAPYQAALQRLFQVVRASVVGPAERRVATNPFKSTDNAIGRYIYVTANDVESRIYYETAGTGPVPLLLQATAGTDGREYRHMLADPRMQERFTMYAYDLPFHGKSLPPEGVRWWEQPYLPTQEYLINWVVGIADALELHQPFFLGTSVGGQLALDLAAERGERFGGFISVNGWYDVADFAKSFDNNQFRTPGISAEMFPALNFGATAPNAPEEYAHEVYWIYRSNFAGIYAGDNDYFMRGHDLKVNGHKIDAKSKPVYVVTGEYDAASHDPEHGGPAVARHIPGAVFIEAEGLGHFAPSDDPIAFSDFIIPVLDKALAHAMAGAPA